MGSRRKGRECALQLLYQYELVKTEFLIRAEQSLDDMEVSGEAREFALRLLQGVQEHRGQFDQLLEESSSHWKVSRMAAVDKNILRIALFELLYCSDIPMKVTINEAIEIAKRFGTTESGAFVNGILDNIAQHASIDKKEKGEME